MEAISGSCQVNGEPEKRTSDTSEGRLKYFIEFFIKCFEGKSDEFGWEARVGGAPKKGKVCGMMPESISKPSTAVAGFLGAPGWVATTVGVSYSFLKKPIMNLLRKSHRKKAKTLTGINVEYGPSTIRRVLAEAAANIFYSFQTQLIAIYDQDGLWWRGLEKFAIDARDRIINYLTQDKAFDGNISCSILVKALLQGQSKQNIKSRCRFGKTGHTIKLKNVDEKTESLFEVVGVKRFDDSSEITYYIKKGLEPKHERYDHEFRYLLKWEEASDWQNMYEKATDIIAAKATTISVTQDDLKQYVSDALEYINSNERGCSFYEELPNTKKPPEKIFNVQPLVSNFEGRDEELVRLHGLLQTENNDVVITKCAAVTGLGGIGKTELAKKYSHKYKDAYDGRVIWINSESEESLRQSYKKVAKKLDISTEDDSGEIDTPAISQEVFDYFSHSKCLYVFDNVEGFEDIKDYLPECPTSYTIRPSILITSRNSNWFTGQRGKIEPMRLGVFSKEEAKSYVKKELEIQDDCLDHLIDTLTDKLSYFPLALRQAVSYMKPDDESLSVRQLEEELMDYLELWERDSSRLLQQKCSLDYYEKTVYITWKITIKAIEEKNGALGQLSKQLLEMLAYLPSDGCKIRHFSSAEALKALKTTEKELRKAFKLLYRYSLISIINEDELNMHRLVQEIIRHWLKEANREAEALQNVLELSLHSSLDISFQMEHFWTALCEYTLLINDFILPKRDCTPFLALTYAGNVSVLMKFLKKSAESIHIEEIFQKILELSDFDISLIKTGQNYKEFSTNFLLFHAHFRQVLRMKNYDDLNAFVETLPKWIEKTVVLDSKFIASCASNSNVSDKHVLDTPIEKAVRGGDFYLTQFLIRNGANHESPWLIFIAAAESDSKILKLIARSNEACEVTDGCGMTPLHIAAWYGNSDTVKFLFEMSVDTEIYDNERKKAIEYALMRGKKEVVEIFYNYKKLNVNEKFEDSCCPLLLAAESGVSDLVMFLIENGADKNSEANNGIKVIHAASMSCNSDILQLFGENKAEFEQIDHNGWTPLHYAAASGNVEALTFLLEKGVDPHLCDKHNRRPIEYALVKGHEKFVEFFLNRDWLKVNEKFRSGLQPLHLAAMSGNTALVLLLIEKGADKNCTLNDGYKMIHWAAQECNTEILGLFGKSKFQCEERDDRGWTPLHHAAHSGKLEAVKFLLEKKVDPNLCDNNNCKPVEYALQAGRLEIVEFFLSRNLFNVNEKTRNEHHPLHLAALSDNAALIRFLIDAGADKNCKTEGGSKMIHWVAEECNNPECLKLFGESKEVCEEKNNQEWTPLHYAANYGNLEAVTFLAEKKVDPHLCDDNECEPIEFALHNGRLEIVEFFLVHGWLDVNARFRNTVSPIHLAVLSGNAALVRFLIENGADKNCETEYGMKAIHYAARDCNCEILKLFGESKEQCEQKDYDGWTPLHYAAAYGNLEAATFLIEMKVDPHPRDNEGFKPVEYALNRGKREIVELFNQLDGRE